MPRKLEILNKDDWFLKEEDRDRGNPGYPIYYRYAITYSIAKNILTPESQNTSTKNQEWVIEQINNLLECIEKKEAYKDNSFVELYPLANDLGYVLVDQTDSYYPLIFYSNTIPRKGNPRVAALEYSLKDIKNGIDEIFNEISKLETITNWTQDFQRKLYYLFPDNSDKYLEAS